MEDKPLYLFQLELINSSLHQFLTGFGQNFGPRSGPFRLNFLALSRALDKPKFNFSVYFLAESILT